MVNDEHLVEVRDAGDIPGVTSQGACAETAHVIGEVGSDLLNELQGKSAGRGGAYCGGLGRSTPGTYPLDSGSTSIPNSLDEELNR